VHLLQPVTLAAALLLAGCRTPGEWATLKTAIATRFPSIEHLTTVELAAQMARSEGALPLLLDNRDAAEFAVSHLAGAHPSPDLPAALTALAHAPLDTPVVAYCSVGYRSAELVEQLQRAGYTAVRNLEGSIFQWANEGRPLYRGEERVSTVHPYGEPWSRFLAPERRAPLP